jgi:NADH-quinone oxidoreductase subunit J
MTTAILFYAYAAVAIAGAIGLVAARQLVHAVMSLFATLVAIGALFLLLGSQFLAAAQLFIYGGAITVLVLFVLMFTGADVRGGSESPRSVRLAALAVGLGFFVLLAAGFVSAKWQTRPAHEETVNAVASILFSRLAIPFEIAGLALTVALIGAIVLGREDDVLATPARAANAAETASHTETADAGDAL